MKKVSLLFAVFIILIGLFSFSVSALDINTLSDGEYEIDIELWHAEDSKKSMAASAFEKTAVIMVENGSYTVRIYTGPMTIMMITASLQEMRVQLSDGTYVNAEVAERGSDGNPTSFTFPIDTITEFVNVKVNPKVAVIGNMEMDARLKFDISSVREKSEEETTAEETTAEVTTQEPTTKKEEPTTTKTETTTAAPVVETTATPVAETTAAPVVETTVAPVAETTAAPVVETTVAPVAETTAAPEIATTEAVAAEETTQEALSEDTEKENGGGFGIMIAVAVVIISAVFVVVIIKKKKSR